MLYYNTKLIYFYWNVQKRMDCCSKRYAQFVNEYQITFNRLLWRTFVYGFSKLPKLQFLYTTKFY